MAQDLDAIVSRLTALTTSEMRSTAHVLSLYQALRTTGLCEGHTLVDLCALIACALRWGQEPPRLLTMCLLEHDWSLIKPRDRALAWQRVRALAASRRHTAAQRHWWQAELDRLARHACQACATWLELSGKVPAVCPLCGRGGGVPRAGGDREALCADLDFQEDEP
jgi:hypothetical protein